MSEALYRYGSRESRLELFTPGLLAIFLIKRQGAGCGDIRSHIVGPSLLLSHDGLVVGSETDVAMGSLHCATLLCSGNASPTCRADETTGEATEEKSRPAKSCKQQIMLNRLILKIIPAPAVVQDLNQ
jgi:hypothetical protein